jgi:hypothetical protein
MIKTGKISLGVKGLALCGVLLASGCGEVTERDFTNREMDKFVAAMISVDCKVSFENAEVVEDATGFSEEKLMAITDYLKEKQLVVRLKDIDGLELINEGCP